MTQVLWTEDGTLPQGLTIQNAYTELQKGSKYVVIVVRNSMAYPQNDPKESSSGQSHSCDCSARNTTRDQGVRGEDGPKDPHAPSLTMRQRQGKLFEELDLSGLNSWPPELVEAACHLLAEYHDVFSLEPMELGGTHSTEHTIKVTDDTPFKEQFRWIPLPLVEEVQSHLREMLESGAIQPSAWCNAIVLVRKKDGGLQFCIDFCCLNVHRKKDSYPLPRIQEALESLVGARHFLCLDLKSGFWQIRWRRH